MASIVCSTCGAQVADTQTECPACGTPSGFLPPDKPKRTKQYVLIGIAAVVVLGMLALFVSLVRPRPEVASPAALPAKKAVEKAVAPEPEKPAPPVAVARQPQTEPVAPPVAPRVAEKNGVYFLAVYAAGAGGELLRELRPVVAGDESAMNDVIKSAAQGLALRPLGLSCGPDRSPFYAWVSSREGAPQSTVQVQVGAACGFATLAEAAQGAMDACRKRGGCQQDATEIQLYAADMRDSPGEAWRARPRLWCQFGAGKIANAWQYLPEKTAHDAGCAALL